MKRLTKLDIWQMGGFAILWIIHNRTLYMIGVVAAAALHKAIRFLGLWFICIAMRRREIWLKTIGIAIQV